MTFIEVLLCYFLGWNNYGIQQQDITWSY